MDGILNINKPGGITSHDVVSRIRKLCDIRRVGHAGTLDPMATGVLPVLVGNAAAAQEYLTGHDKEYRAGIRFGILTNTGDITGTVLQRNRKIPDRKTILAAANQLIGKTDQIPPMHSAIKVDGKKLYELAREGKTIERAARQIRIDSIRFLGVQSDTDYLFDIRCSKGTYIRTLCEDIGKIAGCAATLYSLERRAVGEFHIDQAVTLETLEDKKSGGEIVTPREYLIPVETVFSQYPAVTLSEFFSRLSKNGAEIYLRRAGIDDGLFDRTDLCRMYDESGRFYAIGMLSEYKQGKAIKAKIRFDTERKRK